MRIKYFTSFGYVVKGALGYLAYFSILPYWLAAWLHKKRGVRIADPREVYIAPNVLLDTLFPELITIENGVYLTRGVKIICHTNYTPLMQEVIGAYNASGEVVIGAGAFIGVNSIVLPNVRIGCCALVAAGSVVTKNVPDFSIVGGNPAEVIGDIRSLKERSGVRTK